MDLMRSFLVWEEVIIYMVIKMRLRTKSLKVYGVLYVRWTSPLLYLSGAHVFHVSS